LAHSASAIKRIRQNAERRERNRSNRSRLRSQIKKLRQALETLEATSAEDAKKLLPSTMSLVDVMVKKGIIHRNTGNRYKSRLSRRLASSRA
jgi:small subunit ribosomal protein S20